MKLRHRIPSLAPLSAHVDPSYEAEVQHHTHRGERAYRKAKQSLARAEHRLAQAVRAQNKHAIKIATELAELRREQLAALEALMKATPASAAHRGVRSFRPVPPPS